VEALAELLRMEDRRQLELDRLRTLLVHSSPVVRRYAALAGGRIGDRSAVPLLVVTLSDTSVAVRANAAFALGLLGDAASAVVSALTALLKEAEDPAVVREAVAALGRIAAPAGSPSTTAAAPAVATALTGLLRQYASGSGNGRPLDAGGREALLTFWRLPELRESLDLLLPYLESRDPQVRWRTLYPFARQPTPGAVAALRAHLRDDDADVRALAARGLGAAIADSAGERTLTLEALLRALDDTAAGVRINALPTIATYRDASTVPAITELTTAANGNVAIAAVQALAPFGEAAAAVLEPIARDSAAQRGLRAAALTALLRASAARGLALAQTGAASADWLERLHAARALAGAVWPDAAPLLRMLARDSDARVAAAALRSIAAADTSAGAVSIYLEALAAGDPGVRAAAAAGLARRPDAAHIAALMEAFARARYDSVSTAALAIVDALGALERNGTPVARAFFLRFPPARDPLVQRRVAQRLNTNGWGPPAAWAANRDASYYRAIVTRLVVPALTDSIRPRVALGTPHGDLQVELFPEEAPLTVYNFLQLVENGFYPGSTRGGRWHRVVPGFVLQDGDPRGDGTGGPGYTIRDEINRIRFARGVLGMAHSGADTGGSQFFITFSAQPHLDGGYTAFGRVVSGMDAADRVVQEDPLHYIRVVR
jgi:cyclophilin family peptidyl-prolyl cis-trans isomerase/HEAT repeat protein